MVEGSNNNVIIVASAVPTNTHRDPIQHINSLQSAVVVLVGMVNRW